MQVALTEKISQLTAVFRREPLWQVSMNVRLHPLVRCLFDEDSHVLRLILKEPVEKPNVPVEQRPQEVVIYVLKVVPQPYPGSLSLLLTLVHGSVAGHPRKRFESSRKRC